MAMRWMRYGNVSYDVRTSGIGLKEQPVAA